MVSGGGAGGKLWAEGGGDWVGDEEWSVGGAGVGINDDDEGLSGTFSTAFNTKMEREIASARPSATTKLMTFARKPTQMAIQRSTTLKINPKNPIESFPIIFEINSSEGMIDFLRSRLRCQFKLANVDGTPIDETKAGKVTVINYLGATFFNRMKFYASNSLLYDSLDAYTYKAYVDAVLFEPAEMKSTLLVSALYHEDTGGVEPNDATKNKGFVKRHELTKKSTFTTISPLHADIFTPDALYPRMVDFRIELYRNNDDFLLLASKASNENYTLTLTKAQLDVHIVYPLPSFSLAYERTLAKTPARFNVKKTEMKVLHLGTGRVDLPNACLHCGVIPRRVIMFMVPSVAYFGTRTSSPLCFNPHGLERYQLIANDKLFPQTALEMDFGGGDALDAYRQLFESLAGSSNTCTLTYEQFVSGYSFIVTDLSPDASGSSGTARN